MWILGVIAWALVWELWDSDRRREMQLGVSPLRRHAAFGPDDASLGDGKMKSERQLQR
jgi:hypothetical protein